MSTTHTAADLHRHFPNHHRPRSGRAAGAPGSSSSAPSGRPSDAAVAVAGQILGQVHGSRLHCASNQEIEDTSLYGVGTLVSALPDWGHAPRRFGSAKGSRKFGSRALEAEGFIPAGSLHEACYAAAAAATSPARYREGEIKHRPGREKPPQGRRAASSRPAAQGRRVRAAGSQGRTRPRGARSPAVQGLARPAATQSARTGGDRLLRRGRWRVGLGEGGGRARPCGAQATRSAACRGEAWAVEAAAVGGAGWRRRSGGRKRRRRLCTGEKGVAAVERETSGLGLGLRVGVVL